jgi:tetrahydromethanopterin S-methyltransferase subunit G
MDGNQWYNNKQLFELFIQLKDDLKDTRSDLKDTQSMIKQYNGLREKIDTVEKKVKHIETTTEAKQGFGQAVRDWGGWIFGLITLLVLLSQYF